MLSFAQQDGDVSDWTVGQQQECWKQHKVIQQRVLRKCSNVFDEPFEPRRMNPKPDLSRRITTDLASLHKQHTTSHIKNPSPIGVGGDDNTRTIFIVLSSSMATPYARVHSGNLSQSRSAPGSCQLVGKVGYYRPNIHPLPYVLLFNHEAHSHVTSPTNGGSLSQPSVQPVSKAMYRSAFCEKHRYYLHCAFTWGIWEHSHHIQTYPPHDHCDLLWKMFTIYVKLFQHHRKKCQ